MSDFILELQKVFKKMSGNEKFNQDKDQFEIPKIVASIQDLSELLREQNIM